MVDAANTVLQQQQTILDPSVQAYYNGLLQLAKARAEQPADIPAYQFADMTDMQKQAFANTQNGIGAYQPYLNAAGQDYTAAGQQFNNMGAMTQAGVNAVTGAQTAAQVPLTTAQGQFSNLDRYGNAAINANVNAQTAAISPLDQAQQQFAKLNNVGQNAVSASQAGVNAANPLINTAQQSYGTAANLAQSGTQAFDPNSISDYMNPYQNQVIKSAMDEINRQQGLEQQNLDYQAVKAGAFGGQGAAFAKTEAARNREQTRNQTLSNLLFTGYGNAQNAALGAFNNQQAREQTAAGLTNQQAAGVGSLASQLAGMNQNVANTTLGAGSLAGQGASGLSSTAGQIYGMGQGVGNANIQAGNLAGQGASGLSNTAAQQFAMGQGVNAADMQQAALAGTAGQGIASLGNAQGYLGGLNQNLGQADTSYLYNMGAQQQRYTQAQLDAARNLAVQKAQQPFAQIGFASDIFHGVPSGSTVTTQGYSQAPSAASQFLGNTMGIYGALNQANKPAASTNSGYTGYTPTP